MSERSIAISRFMRAPSRSSTLAAVAHGPRPAAGGRGLHGGSRIGARYRHTTDAMTLGVVEAIQERLTIALRVAEDTPADRQATRRVC